MDGNKLGETLKDRRQAKGLTLQQVSIVSGVSLTHIGRIERGDRSPSARTLRNLAAPLGFSETELFKIANFLSRDENDQRVDKLKQEVKEEIARAISVLSAKIDSL